MYLLKFIIVVLSLLTTEMQSTNEIMSKFRLTRSATVEITDETEQFLIESVTFSFLDRSFCLLRCNENPNCDLVVLDEDQNRCRFYKKTFLVCLKPANESNQIVYDKFVKWLWFCCNRDSNYIYQPNLTSSNCFYFNPSLSAQWNYSYQYCLGLNNGFMLAVLDKNDVFEYSKNLTQTTFWVNSRTDTPRVFYWPDGSNITNWGPGQPDNKRVYPTSIVYEGCVSMTWYYGFNDASCSSSFTFLCYIPNR